MVIDKEIITTDTILILENETIINRFCHILPGAVIGKNCMIGERCYISKNAIIGDNVRIQNGNDIWDGVRICDDVFIGPHCNLTNHHNPADRVERDFKPDITYIHRGATLSTNVTVVAPCEIGEKARIGAGSIVIRNIEAGEKVNWLVK